MGPKRREGAVTAAVVMQCARKSTGNPVFSMLGKVQETTVVPAQKIRCGGTWNAELVKMHEIYPNPMNARLTGAHLFRILFSPLPRVVVWLANGFVSY